MIIALPSEHHDHLADALVRDLGFTRQHVDQPIRDLLLKIDPIIVPGASTVNRGPSPYLSGQLENLDGTAEERWSALLHPRYPGAASDQRATEVRRLLDVLRGELDGDRTTDGDTVLVGVEKATLQDRIIYGNTESGASAFQFVAIRGRVEADSVNHWIEPVGVVGEQEAIVRYVQELREPKARIVPENTIVPPDLTAEIAIDAQAEDVRLHNLRIVSGEGRIDVNPDGSTTVRNVGDTDLVVVSDCDPDDEPPIDHGPPLFRGSVESIVVEGGHAYGSITIDPENGSRNPW